jgi:hypothetical protein
MRYSEAIATGGFGFSGLFQGIYIDYFRLCGAVRGSTAESFSEIGISKECVLLRPFLIGWLRLSKARAISSAMSESGIFPDSVCRPLILHAREFLDAYN